MKTLGLGYLFALLLSANVLADDALPYKVEVLAKSSASWDGTLLPNYPTATPLVSILRIAIPPGVQLPMHKHPIINAGVLTQGELNVYTEDGKVLRMKKGDALIEVVNTWHYGKNEGTETAEIVVFYAGAADTPLSVKQ